MALVVTRFDVYLVRLDPTEGPEIQKTRPCVVISPDEMTTRIGTVIVAPLSTAGRAYPTRVALTFAGRSGQVVLDQLRTVDKRRLLEHLGRIDDATATRVLAVLADLFAL